MKQRTITALILLIILTPLVIVGKKWLAGMVIFVLMFCSVEILTAQRKQLENKKRFPWSVVIIYIVCAYGLVFGVSTFGYEIFKSNFNWQEGTMEAISMSTFWLAASLGLLLMMCVIKKNFLVSDAFYLFTMLIFISLGLQSFLYIRSIPEIDIIRSMKVNSDHTYIRYQFSGLFIALYIIVTTMMTDTGGYIGGILYRKTKKPVHLLIERVSPKKTIEGAVVATVCGTVCGSLVFGLLVCKYDFFLPWYIFVPMSFILSITAQFGDLIFSCIKRFYGIKDFGNILPGHGGVLDRIDSMLLNSIIFGSFFYVFIQTAGMFA